MRKNGGAMPRRANTDPVDAWASRRAGEMPQAMLGGYRQGFSMRSGSAPRRPEQQLSKAFGRRRRQLAMLRRRQTARSSLTAAGRRLYSSLLAHFGIN